MHTELLKELMRHISVSRVLAILVRERRFSFGRMSAQVESDSPSCILHYDIVLYMEEEEEEESFARSLSSL